LSQYFLNESQHGLCCGMLDEGLLQRTIICKPAMTGRNADFISGEPCGETKGAATRNLITAGKPHTKFPTPALQTNDEEKRASPTPNIIW